MAGGGYAVAGSGTRSGLRKGTLALHQRPRVSRGLRARGRGERGDGGEPRSLPRPGRRRIWSVDSSTSWVGEMFGRSPSLFGSGPNLATIRISSLDPRTGTSCLMMRCECRFAEICCPPTAPRGPYPCRLYVHATLFRHATPHRHPLDVGQIQGNRHPGNPASLCLGSHK